MADTSISNLTLTTPATAAHRIPIAITPFGSGNNGYITPALILSYGTSPVAGTTITATANGSAIVMSGTNPTLLATTTATTMGSTAGGVIFKTVNIDVMNLSSNTGGLVYNGTYSMGFAAAPLSSASVADSAFSRISAGIIGVGNGTAGDFTGTLKLTTLIATSSITGSGAGNLTFSSGAYDLVFGTAGRTYFTIAKSTDISTNNMSVGYDGLAFGDFTNAGIGFRNGYPSDTATGAFSIAGNNAYASASTNLVGGAINITGGAGASGSVGAAIGGAVNINGGTGYGTGAKGAVVIQSSTATPAGGSTAARLVFGTTAGFGIYYGSGAPSVSAAKGSLYLRSDGSSTSTRTYINTDGGTTWTAVTTVA